MGNDAAATSARQGHEPPSAIAVNGWRYHHMGIPTRVPRPDEVHVPHLKIHVAGFESSPCGIQWMRFDEDAPYAEIVMTVPHVAFEVDDLDAFAARLREKQVKFKGEPVSTPVCRFAVITDPDGNQIILHKRNA